MADAGVLRRMNEALVRGELHGGARKSKTELARATGLSFPTVGKTIAQMVESGELREAGTAGSTGGRAACLYELRPDFALSLLLRLEGERLRWTVADLGGAAVDGGETLCRPPYLEPISALAVRVKERYPQLDELAFGIAAAVSQGVVLDAVLYPELRGVTLTDELKDRCGVHVCAENDMNAAALGCWMRRPLREGPLCCLYIGENGAGSCTVLGGRVLRGAHGFAGEIGCLPLTERPPAVADFARMDMTAYYSGLIRCHAALFDPECIVLYDNPWLEGRFEAVLEACGRHLPTSVEIVRSDAFAQDYEAGLAALAEKAREERRTE